MAKRFYIKGHAGPLTAAQVKEMAAAGHIKPDSQIRRAESQRWHRADTVQGIVFASTSLDAVELDPAEFEPQPLDPILEAFDEPISTGSRRCPFCDESIAPGAKKCRHCHEILDPAMRAAEEAKRASQPSSTTVIMREEGGKTPHLLHLIITVLTCGAWLPLWAIHWMINRGR